MEKHVHEQFNDHILELASEKFQMDHGSLKKLVVLRIMFMVIL